MLLGELLLKKKLITSEQLDKALEEQKKTKDFLGEILVRRRSIKEEDLIKVLSEQFNIPYVNLKNQYIDWGVALRFSSSLVVERRCLPFRQDEYGFTVAITNPLDALAVSQAEKEARTEKVKLVLVSSAGMDQAIKNYRAQASARVRKMLE